MSGDKLTDAKAAAISSLAMLRDIDHVGVIAFDDSYDTVVDLKPLSGRRDQVTEGIGRIVIEGGTSIYPAVQEAKNQLKKSHATIKHIILLTDGQDGYNFSNYQPLIRELNNENITLSSIALGNDCNEQLLGGISESTGGRMYVVTNNKELPQIFAQEIYFSQNEYLVDREGPVYITSSDDVISEVVSSGVPDIKAYVATTLKPRATGLLTTEDDYPLLSYWQYGLGKTVAWASDVTGNWSGNYYAWEKNTLLWNNLIQLVTKDTSADGSYATVNTQLSTATVQYHTDDFNAGTTVSATITDDQGNTEEVTLLPRSPGEFSTDFDLTSEGVYSIAIKQYENGVATSGLSTAAIKKYSPEYIFSPDNALLSESTRLTGGSEISSPSQVFTGMKLSINTA
jgi:hypothetical protein